MLKVWIYAAVLIVVSIVCLARKNNLLGCILWALYAIIGIFAVLCVENGMLVSFLDTSIVPYLYLVLIYGISFLPFVHNSELQSFKFKKDLPLQYYIFSVMYIIMSLVTIRIYLPRVRELMSTSQWFKNIEEMYEGKLVYPYTNIIEYICIQVVSYTRILAMILGFAMLRERKSTVHGIILIGSAVSTALLNALNISSRGLILNCFLLVVSIYIYFKNQYEKKTRICFKIAILIGVIALIPVLSDITVSRFTQNEASKTLLRYFGQSPVVFSGGVSGIEKYTYGVHGFGTLFNQGFSQAAVGGSWGTGFYTFVGWLYLDWGPLGTIIVVSMTSFVIWKTISKEKHELSDLFLIFFIYYTLLQGVFVIGRTYCYQILMAAVVYLFLKLLSDNKDYYIGLDNDGLNIIRDSKKNNTCKYFK